MVIFCQVGFRHFSFLWEQESMVLATSSIIIWVIGSIEMDAYGALPMNSWKWGKNGQIFFWVCRDVPHEFIFYDYFLELLSYSTLKICKVSLGPGCLLV